MLAVIAPRPARPDSPPETSRASCEPTAPVASCQ